GGRDVVGGGAEGRGGGGGGGLEGGGDLVDRAAMFAPPVGGRQRAVGAHARLMAAAEVAEQRAGHQQAGLDQHAEGNARFAPLARRRRHVLTGQRLHLRDALARDGGVVAIALQANEAPADTRRTGAG